MGAVAGQAVAGTRRPTRPSARRRAPDGAAARDARRLHRGQWRDLFPERLPPARRPSAGGGVLPGRRARGWMRRLDRAVRLESVARGRREPDRPATPRADARFHAPVHQAAARLPAGARVRARRLVLAGAPSTARLQCARSRLARRLVPTGGEALVQARTGLTWARATTMWNTRTARADTRISSTPCCAGTSCERSIRSCPPGRRSRWA